MENKQIYDRFKGLAYYLSGYTKNNKRIGEESETEHIAEIIRRYAKPEKPYILHECPKCKFMVEPEDYKMSYAADDDRDDDEDYTIGFSCPNCRTIFSDSDLKKVDSELMDNQDSIDEKYDEYQHQRLQNSVNEDF